MDSLMESGIFRRYDPLTVFDKYSSDEIRKLPPDDQDLYLVAKNPDLNIIFLRDDAGNDWYKWLRTLSAETLKISYHPETRVIIHFSFDASAIFPIDQIVAEVNRKDIPASFIEAGERALDGSFMYVDGKIMPVPVDYVAEAQNKKRYLLAKADAIIAPLERAVRLGMATSEEAQQLEAWERYSVLVNRVDANLAPDITWPEMPDGSR